MQAPEFWRRSGIRPALLSPLGSIYDAAGRLRRGLVRSWRAPVPVVCAGNLVAGGAGKTPLALSVAGALAARGMTPHFLSRGYGGSTRGPLRVDPDRHLYREVGDEPLLLARAHPTWIAADRPAGARAAINDGCDVIVMDDGLQNPTLQRDVSLIAIDGGYGFGNGRVMPAGPLRETMATGLARAAAEHGAAVVIGRDVSGAAEALGGRLPVWHARLTPSGNVETLAGKPVYAFAGIGRPEKFFASLAEIGCTIIKSRAFPDHHPYGAGEIMQIVEAAGERGAVPVTTAKDAVRLPPEARPMVAVLEVALKWQHADALDTILAQVLGHG